MTATLMDWHCEKDEMMKNNSLCVNPSILINALLHIMKIFVWYWYCIIPYTSYFLQHFVWWSFYFSLPRKPPETLTAEIGCFPRSVLAWHCGVFIQHVGISSTNVTAWWTKKGHSIAHPLGWAMGLSFVIILEKKDLITKEILLQF